MKTSLVTAVIALGLISSFAFAKDAKRTPSSDGALATALGGSIRQFAGPCDIADLEARIPVQSRERFVSDILKPLKENLADGFKVVSVTSKGDTLLCVYTMIRQ